MMSTESQYGQAEQQTDERPGPDELRDHVEHADKDGVERRRRPNAARVEGAVSISASVYLPRFRNGSATSKSTTR